MIQSSIERRVILKRTVPAMENFIRQQFEIKKCIAIDLVHTLPTDIPVGWEEADSGREKNLKYM